MASLAMCNQAEIKFTPEIALYYQTSSNEGVRLLRLGSDLGLKLKWVSVAEVIIFMNSWRGFYCSVQLTIFSGIEVAPCQIKVGRLIGGRLIEVRLYFDFLVLLLTRCVTAPVSVSHKFKDVRANQADLARERERHLRRRAQYKYPNMVKLEKNPGYSARPAVVI